MVVLALETVTRAGSMALWRGGECHAASGDASRTHGERLPNELLHWLHAHGESMATVDRLAVVTGPGSFTGLRIGLAAIQGLAMAAHKRVVGVPTLEALAATWTPADAATTLVVPCLDGQRGQVFFAGYLTDAHGRREVLPAAVGTPSEAAAGIRLVAPLHPLVIVGDGAERYRDELRAELPSALVIAAPMTLAEAAVRLAATRADQAGTPHALRPIYVRRPDAELARERAGIPVRQRQTGPELSIGRVSSADDLKAVEALQRETFTNPWGVDAIRWELENTDVARLYVAREPGGAVVAYCACWVVFDELHINSFAVAPAWRRRGCARTLLTTVIADAKGQGARSATLEVRASNTPARQLYEGLGFRVDAVRRDYYQDPREDALILWNRTIGT